MRTGRFELGRVTVRAAAVPVAGLAVHQLRYWLAFGSGATVELQRTGHSYLHSLVPWIVLLLALSASASLSALGQALASRQQQSRGRRLSFLALWLACASSLALLFSAQEYLEGLFATGHPTGLASIFAYGGWWALPASVAVGLVLAAAFRGTQALITAAARLLPPAPTLRFADQPVAVAYGSVWEPLGSVRARSRSSRGPPAP